MIKCASITLLDFKKAIDTIKHLIFSKKLKHYGIQGITLDLLTLFLINQKQYVVHKDNFSDAAIEKFGVPQGSYLGPLVFLIYINDIPNALNSMPSLFVYDTHIRNNNHQSNQVTLTEKMNGDLANVHKWTKRTKLL